MLGVALGLTLVAASLVIAHEPVAAGAPAVAPGSNGGSFVVEDVVSQFHALKHHGEALAWRNDESCFDVVPLETELPES